MTARDSAIQRARDYAPYMAESLQISWMLVVLQMQKELKKLLESS
mgnify:CR=1 FL=1